jgi:hypothetical protein
MAEEEELELSLGTKKEKKTKSKSKPASDPAVDAAAKGVEAVDLSARPAAGATSTSTSYHDYMFLLERLYLTHNDRFGVDKDKEKSRCGLRARARALHRRVFFTIDCSGSKCPRHK